MNKIKIVIVLIFGLIPLLSNSQELTNILPKNNEIKGWQIVDTLKLYKGDELYTYVDGGAEIFMEFGFLQVATATYTDKENRQLQVEIYDMTDSASAYGTYTFYLNGEGKEFKAGQEAMLIDYYGIAHKGNLLVVISAPVIDDSLKTTIVLFANSVCNKSVKNSNKPSIVTMVEKNSLSTGFIKYIEGNVGLSNIYKFIPGGAFAFQQGVSFENNNNRIIVFQYSTENEAKQQLAEALLRMKQANKETLFTNIDNGFNYVDYKKNIVMCEAVSKYILITVGKEIVNVNASIEKVTKALK